MASVGLVVGSLVAFTSVNLASRLFLTCFTLIGGSVAALFHKIPPKDRSLAGAALCAISLGSLAGIYSGIIVRQYQLLTPPARRTYANPSFATPATPAAVQTSDNQAPPIYLNRMEEDALRGILLDFEDKKLNLDQAIERIEKRPLKPPIVPSLTKQEPAHSNP